MILAMVFWQRAVIAGVEAGTHRLQRILGRSHPDNPGRQSSRRICRCPRRSCLHASLFGAAILSSSREVDHLQSQCMSWH